MSLVFNDTTLKRGLVQMYEKELGFEDGDVSGSTARLKEFAADANLAFDDFVALAIQADGTWQYDDSNQTDYPIITSNLVANQRDYPFTTDGSGNLILDIYRAFVADANGIFREIRPVDVNSGDDGQAIPGVLSGNLGYAPMSTFTDGQNKTGTPTRYDKLANGIFLDPIPSYNYTNGLKLYVNREPSYFAYGDTTKKPGVPGLFHNYFFKKPAQQYAARKSMSITGGRLRNGAFTGLLMEVNDIEENIKTYFSRRTKDEKGRLRAGVHDNH